LKTAMMLDLTESYISDNATAVIQHGGYNVV